MITYIMSLALCSHPWNKSLTWQWFWLWGFTWKSVVQDPLYPLSGGTFSLMEKKGTLNRIGRRCSVLSFIRVWSCRLLCLLSCLPELCLVGRRRGEGMSFRLRQLSQCLRYSHLFDFWSQETYRRMGREQRGLGGGEVELRRQSLH